MAHAQRLDPFLELLSQLVIEDVQVCQVLVAPFFQHVIKSSLQLLGLHRALHEFEALFHQIKLCRIKFFGFDQHLFAYANFAEIVQQGSIADLPHFFARETQVGIGSAFDALHRLGERDRQVGNPERVA